MFLHEIHHVQDSSTLKTAKQLPHHEDGKTYGKIQKRY